MIFKVRVVMGFPSSLTATTRKGKGHFYAGPFSSTFQSVCRYILPSVSLVLPPLCFHFISLYVSWSDRTRLCSELRKRRKMGRVFWWFMEFSFCGFFAKLGPPCARYIDRQAARYYNRDGINTFTARKLHFIFARYFIYCKSVFNSLQKKNFLSAKLLTMTFL